MVDEVDRTAVTRQHAHSLPILLTRSVLSAWSIRRVCAEAASSFSSNIEHSRLFAGRGVKSKGLVATLSRAVIMNLSMGPSGLERVFLGYRGICHTKIITTSVFRSLFHNLSLGCSELEEVTTTRP